MIDDRRTNVEVPVSQKAMLTVREAVAYSNIGINQIRALLRQPNFPFVLYIGNRTLVKRVKFEEFLDNTLYIEPGA